MDRIEGWEFKPSAESYVWLAEVGRWRSKVGRREDDMAISDLEAARLRAKWGGRSCDHPDYEYERSSIGGAKTGDIVCVQCGKTWGSYEPEAQAVIKKATERRK